MAVAAVYMGGLRDGKAFYELASIVHEKGDGIPGGFCPYPRLIWWECSFWCLRIITTYP